MMNPVASVGMNGKGKTGGWFGWPEDAEMEKLRDAYARELDLGKQKSVAEAIQTRATELGMYYPTGMYKIPIASRGLSGFVHGPAPVFWNIEKK